MPIHEIDMAPKPSKPSLLVRLLWNAFVFAYGTFSLGAFVLLAFFRKNSFRRLSDQSREELAIARDKLWDLSKHPDGLNHRFCNLRNGTKLHYVEAVPHNPPLSNTSLVIFLHGFPDSWILWQQYLRCGKLREHTNMVALDLPGFGGSDSLQSYGPEDVLEAVTEYILQMREQYVSGKLNARVIVAAHDWGALVGFRLASEAPQLADRFILSNSIHPALAYSNVQARLASASQMLHTWIRNPLDFKILRRVFSNAYPLFKQLGKSGYIFIFNLPRPMANSIGTVGDYWFLRYLNAVSTHPDPPKPLPGAHGAEMLAGSLGPSMEECVTSGDGELTYSKSVRQRAQTGSWFEKIRVYREGLAFLSWNKSLETLWDLTQIEQVKGRRHSSSIAPLFDTGPEGSLKAPTTVIWGKRDVAIENSIALEGFNDFFGCKSSQVIMIQKCGHWTPVEKQGAPVFEEVIAWAASGENGTLKNRLGDNFPMASIIAER